MGKRMRRTIVWMAMFIGVLLVLSRILPHHSEIVVSGPDGEYRMESTGTGTHHPGLELSDGNFVECGAQ